MIAISELTRDNFIAISELKILGHWLFLWYNFTDWGKILKAEKYAYDAMFLNSDAVPYLNQHTMKI